MTTQDFTYAYNDIADGEVQQLLRTIPARWGRMVPLSRAVVVEAGKILLEEGFIGEDPHQGNCGRTIGLIGGSRYGSYSTDLTFADTIKDNVQFASPAIFGYTLANIPLAEAANQFGLIGPVYSLIDLVNPLTRAIEEARRILVTSPNIDFMLACEFDDHYDREPGNQLFVNFTLVKQHD